MKLRIKLDYIIGTPLSVQAKGRGQGLSSSLDPHGFPLFFGYTLMLLVLCCTAESPQFKLQGDHWDQEDISQSTGISAEVEEGVVVSSVVGLIVTGASVLSGWQEIKQRFFLISLLGQGLPPFIWCCWEEKENLRWWNE